MARRSDETFSQLDTTDELPVLREPPLRRVPETARPETPGRQNRLEDSVESLRALLESADRRWHQLEERLEIQDRAISELRHLLHLETTAAEQFDDEPFEEQLADQRYSTGRAVPGSDEFAAPAAEVDATTRVPELTDIVPDLGLTLPEECQDAAAPEATPSLGSDLPPAFGEQDTRDEAHDRGLDADADTDVTAVYIRPTFTDPEQTMALPDNAAEGLARAGEETPGQIPLESASQTEVERLPGSPVEPPSESPAVTASAATAEAIATTAPAVVAAPTPDSRRKEQALRQDIAALEAYINGRSSRWAAMEADLQGKAARISELEAELRQRILREEMLAQRLHAERARNDDLKARLGQAERLLRQLSQSGGLNGAD